MGRIELVKNKTKVVIKDGKLKIKKAINWGETLEYWNQDKEAFDKRILIYNTA